LAFRLAKRVIPPVNEVLMRIILRLAALLELSDPPDVDPDMAVRQLEEVAALLQGLDQDEREAFVAFTGKEANAVADPEYRDFLLGFPANVGLV
jgi:hypothetical protein